MDHPDGFDPNAGLWQDQHGQWHRFHIPNPSGPENLTSSQSEGPPSGASSNSQPHPGYSQHSGGLNAQVASFPHAQAASFPPVQGGPPALYHTNNLPPPHYPLPPTHPVHAPNPRRTVAAESPSPPSSPDPMREVLAQHARAGQADKGKKRAIEPDETPAVSKKPKPTPVPKGKGKAKAPTESSKSSAHTGRQPGSHNYSTEDLDALLDIIKALLPIGQASWEEVTRRFNAWAKENGRPARTQKPLKTKFEALVRTPKPTGTAEIPPHVVRAYNIEDMINTRIHLRDLDDDEVADELSADDAEPIEIEDSDLEGADDAPAPSKAAKSKATGPVLKTFRTDGIAPRTSTQISQAATAAARPPAATPRLSTSTRRAQAQDFMSAVTVAFDPTARDTRDETRFARRLAQSDIDRLTQENRDLRQRNDTLVDRLQQQSLQLQQQVTETNRLQSRLDMLEMVQAMTGRTSGGRAQWEDDYRRRHYDDYRGRSRQAGWDSPRTPRRHRSHSVYSPRTPRFHHESALDARPRSPVPSASFRQSSSTLSMASSSRQVPTVPVGPSHASPIRTAPSLSGQFAFPASDPLHTLASLAVDVVHRRSSDSNLDSSSHYDPSSST